MKSDDIIMKAAIIHILDSSVGIPVLSDQAMEIGPDFSDFLKAHIEKITESDDIKQCSFSDSSPLKELIENCTPDNFVETSKQLAENLYDIMNSNIDIPAADIAILVFSCEGCDYLGFLKMNYKTSYTMPLAKRKEVTAMILFFSALCCRLRDRSCPRPSL